MVAGPIIHAPVGNRHPDVSREAADKITHISATQRDRVTFILSQVGRRGMPADDISLRYNRFFRPRKRIANEMASRLQELRGESKDSRQVMNPPWVEYVYDEEPLNDRESLDRNHRLKRLNCNGNYALCQRLTDTSAAWLAARMTEEKLVAEFGYDAVQVFVEEIRRDAGRRPRRRLVRIGGRHGNQSTPRQPQGRAGRDGGNQQGVRPGDRRLG